MRDAAAWGSALGPLSGLSLCCLFSFLTLLAILSLLFIVLCVMGEPWGLSVLGVWASRVCTLGWPGQTDNLPVCWGRKVGPIKRCYSNYK